MMKVTLIALALLLILTCSQSKEVIQTISLMRRIGTIVVAKSTKLTPIAMTILTGKNDDPLEKWLSDSADKIKSVLSMPGIFKF